MNGNGVWRVIAVGFITASVTMAVLWVGIGRSIMTRPEINDEIDKSRREFANQIAVERAVMSAVVNGNSKVIAKLELSLDRVNVVLQDWLRGNANIQIKLEAVERRQQERIEKLDDLLIRRSKSGG